ncbi:MAG TPA: glycosyltransferase family A protein [Deltaproteobacteria bacterium]|nr:glycosyltransferase family A protein [Deltaproteobacteria bacterium]HPR50500.1 glycosyltransferase family A protein [Deltaproteobacteria bacterium]
MIKVSIIIPVYNVERFVAASIQSALDQTLENKEIIVINDGSTDGSEREIMRFKDRIVYIRQDNTGVAAARNVGIRAAKGEYIAFFDADDVFRPDKVEKQASFLDNHPDYCMVYSGYSRINEEGDTLPPKDMRVHVGDIFPQVFMRCFIAPSMVLCRKQVLFDIGLFQTKYSAEDYDLFLKISMQGKIGYIPEPLTQYRVRQGSLSKIAQSTPALQAKELLDQYKDYLLENYPLGWWYYRRRMSKIYRELARVYRDTGQNKDMVKVLKKSIRFYPFRLDVWQMYLGTFLYK